MAWATVDDVEDITGHGATPDVVAQADAMITIFANRTPDAAEGMATRDLYWLRQAVAWQARWLTQQAAVDGRSTHSSIGQDGVTVTHDSPSDIVLAPLAARALKNLTWKATKTVNTRPVYADEAWADRFLNEASDEHHSWQPLGGHL